MGYANLFSAILTSLNIDNRIALNFHGNHARNLVHIKDEKYNIDTVLFFDVTGDSRKKNDKDYLEKYNFFGLTLANAHFIMEEEIYNLFSHYDDPHAYLHCEEYFELAIKGSFERFIDKLSLDKEDEAKEIFEKVTSKYKKGIDIKSFTIALYNTREVEYDSYIIDEINLKVLRTAY